jgi:3-oxoacyl-[acyl-carrier protein] reductase
VDLKIDGKRALVTGSSSGLGDVIATTLAAEGAAVVVHGRDPKRTEAVAQRITGTGGTASVAIGDLATDSSADHVADAALKDGPIDILVNNAGAYEQRSWEDVTSADWVTAYEINVIASVRMIRRLVPAMRQRSWGRVIQIGGIFATQPAAMLPHYAASIAARHNLAVSLARELRGTGVTSNIVAPGAIYGLAVRAAFTEMAASRDWGTSWEEIERSAVRELIPNDVERLARASEIATAVAYLASPLADYVSGATIRVDGGAVRSVA